MEICQSMDTYVHKNIFFNLEAVCFMTLFSYSINLVPAMEWFNFKLCNTLWISKYFS